MWSPPPRPQFPAAAIQWFRFRGGCGLGLAAIAYIGVDYLRNVSDSWHELLQPALWIVLAVAAVARVPYYKHWHAELRSAIPFVLSVVFLLVALLIEAISVRSVTAVLGLYWHNETFPLPDTGQWLLLALNEKLPQIIVDLLRARITGLHHFLMLFIMLDFSVLFDSVKAPGLGLGGRYMFTMAIGRLLRAITFVSTIQPSPRPWCATSRFSVPAHPHRWAQKYYIPYSSDSSAIHQIINSDIAFADVEESPKDFHPDWGAMSFLIDFLRPTPPEASSAWYHLLKKAGGGCNDLLYSGHMIVAVLTAMAWTEAYGGLSSALIWVFVMHSAQREIRERHHYSADCVVAIYVGIFLWKMTGLFWPMKEAAERRRLRKLDEMQGQLMRAAKDFDSERVRELLEEVEAGNQESQNSKSITMWVFAGTTIIITFVLVLWAFSWTTDG